MEKLNFKKHFALSSDDPDMTLWQKILHNNLYRIAMGVFVGAIIGVLYWEFIGCNSGTCPLTSNRYKTVAIFSVLGGVYAKKDKRKK